MSATASASWVCCQLGAREHYVVPRALHQAGKLAQLITDAWSTPASIGASVAATLSTRFSQRFHADLAGADVRSMSASLLAREAQWKLQRRDGWDLLIARNEWFQREATALLPQLPAAQTMLFAHSYSSEAILAEGKRRGWKTVLGQIDPGPEHFATQARLAAGRREFGPAPDAPPASYFERWRNECALADWIVVNSEWTRESLIRAGIDEKKLRIMALPFEREAHDAVTRAYPAAFSPERPLRVLFVGTATVAKGVADLLLALERLADAPIALTIAGDRAMDVPDRFLHDPRIDWLGRVDRASIMTHYRQADLLLFPSHSDGFGLAQVEAQGWALPIVASRNCGRVVRDGETGLLLDEVSPITIAAAIERALGDPQALARFARNIDTTSKTGIATLAAELGALEQL